VWCVLCVCVCCVFVCVYVFPSSFLTTIFDFIVCYSTWNLSFFFSTYFSFPSRHLFLSYFTQTMTSSSEVDDHKRKAASQDMALAVKKQRTEQNSQIIASVTFFTSFSICLNSSFSVYPRHYMPAISV